MNLRFRLQRKRPKATTGIPRKRWKRGRVFQAFALAAVGLALVSGGCSSSNRSSRSDIRMDNSAERERRIRELRDEVESLQREADGVERKVGELEKSLIANLRDRVSVRVEDRDYIITIKNNDGFLVIPIDKVDSKAALRRELKRRYPLVDEELQRVGDALINEIWRQIVEIRRSSP